MAKHIGLQPFRGITEALSAGGVGLLVAQLRANFYFDRVASGDRLPPVRKLASQLSISPTTALELYRKLEDSGFVESRERSGTFLRSLGTDEGRTAHESALFALITRTASRLGLMGASPDTFARAFLRYTGAEPRHDFRFGMFTGYEVHEMFTTDLHKRRLPFTVVRLSPTPSHMADVRAQLRRDPSIRCLIASYLFLDVAIPLAKEFGLAMILLRLEPMLAKLFEMPTSGVRYMITRDVEYAMAIRRLLVMLHGPQAATQFCAASVDEPDLMARIAEEATEVHVSPLCWERVSDLFGTTKRLYRLPSNVSDRTREDMLFQYTFASERVG